MPVIIKFAENKSILLGVKKYSDKEVSSPALSTKAFNYVRGFFVLIFFKSHGNLCNQ